MPVERELKLVGDRDDLEALLTAPPVAERRCSPERQERLESIYFDTKDGRLAKRHLALRVRRVHGRFVQTLKRGAGPVRGEWETTLDSQEPVPGPLFMMAGVNDLTDLDVRALRPVLATHVDRRLQEIRLDGAGGEHRIEVAFDVGELKAAERRLPVAEVELELLEGDTSALYDLALELGRVSPLRLETLSKSARGEMLRNNKPPTVRKSDKVDLADCATVEDAMSRIFGACYDQWLANQAAAIDGRDSEGVHQLRVALRRLRSCFASFKQALPADRLATQKQEAKAALGCLGRARDLDVIAEELVLPIRRQRPDDPALEALAARLEDARRAAYRDEVRPGLQAAAYTLFTLDFGGWIARRGWQDSDEVAVRDLQQAPLEDFVRQLLDQRFKVVRKRGRGFDGLSAAERHELRIAIKKLRYALDFTRSLFPEKPVKTMLKTLSNLQDQLGAAHDLAVAHDRLEALADKARGAEAKRLASASGFLLGWHSARASEAERRTGELWRSFKTERPAWREG